MKKILTILILLQLVYSASNAQIKLIGNITTNGKASYPTHIDSLGKGGMMVMPTIGSRDSIPLLRRKFGMLVYVQENDNLYKLKNTASTKKYTDSSDWVTIGLNSTADVDKFLKYAKTSDSLFIIGNAIIDSNLTVMKDLEVKGNLILNTGLQFNDSLVVSKGARIQQGMKLIGKLDLRDTLNVKGISILDDSLYVKGISILSKMVNDSNTIKSKLRVDSTAITTKLRSDSTDLRAKILLDSTAITTKLRGDSTAINRSLVDSSNILNARINTKVNTINGVVQNTLTVNGKATVTDSLSVRGNALIDSNLNVNQNLTVGGKLIVSSGLEFKDSLLVSRGARIDSSLLVKGKIYINDSLIVKGNTEISGNLTVKGINILSKLTADSTTILTRLIDSSGTLNDRINTKVNFADTSSMLMNRLKISDTLTMLNNLLRKTDTATMLSNRLKISDTNTMLSNRLRISDTLTMLSNRLKISDTSTMLSNRIGKDTLNLSSRINTNKQAIIDSSNYLNDRINLKLNSYDTADMLLNRLKISDTATMVSNRLKISDTATMVSNRLKISDTATMVSNRLKISDTSTMLSNRLKISDTSTMLSNRIGRDTVNLSNRIDNLSSTTSTGKLSVTDTAAMLANYARKFTKNFMVKLGSQSIGSVSVPKTLGKYKSGDSVLAKGKTLDELFLDISTEKVSPTYRMPTVSLNATPSDRTIEIGSTLNVTLSNSFTINQGGALGTVTYKRGSTALGSVNDNVTNVTTPISYTVEAAYGNAPVLQNNLGENDSTGIFTAGTAISQEIVFTPKSKRYWGASNNAVITDADLTGTTTTDFNSNASSSPLNIETINVTGSQYIFFAYPASSPKGLLSIDVGGFTSTDAFTQTTKTVVNASGHSQSYIIWVSKNSFSGNISKFYINFQP